MLGITKLSLTTFILGFILFFIWKGSDLFYPESSSDFPAVCAHTQQALDCYLALYAPCCLFEIVSYLFFILFFYHLQVFPPPCHWTPFTKQWFNSMVTKGFCRARPALKKPQVVGYDSLSVGQKKKKNVLLFWKKLVMPIGFTPSTSKLFSKIFLQWE